MTCGQDTQGDHVLWNDIVQTFGDEERKARYSR